MSVLVQDLIDDAASAISDPKKLLVRPDQWLSIYNRSNRELCQKANVLKYEDDFGIVAGQQRYTFPVQMTQMTSLEYSATPDDENSFFYLYEVFEDEFRGQTDRLYPVSTPTNYFCDAGWFYLVPAADTSIFFADGSPGGGFITYFGIPDRIRDVTAAIMQVDDFAGDYLIRRMVIHALEMRNRHAEAGQLLAVWNDDMQGFQDKLNDRSADRRAILRHNRNKFGNMR